MLVRYRVSEGMWFHERKGVEHASDGILTPGFCDDLLHGHLRTRSRCRPGCYRRLVCLRAMEIPQTIRPHWKEVDGIVGHDVYARLVHEDLAVADPRHFEADLLQFPPAASEVVVVPKGEQSQSCRYREVSAEGSDRVRPRSGY